MLYVQANQQNESKGMDLDAKLVTKKLSETVNKKEQQEIQNKKLREIERD